MLLALTINATQARVGHVGAREVIEESASDRFVNSATWGKKKRTEKWSDDETERFFDVGSLFLSLLSRVPLMIEPYACSTAPSTVWD